MRPGRLYMIQIYSRIRCSVLVHSYTLLIIVVLALVFWINRADPGVFDRFLGHIHPLMVTILCGITGMICLSYLCLSFGLPVFQLPTLRSSILPFTGAMVFGTIVIVLDLWLQLPEDLNVRFPISVGFYPAIGFIAEIVFHVAPVTLMASSMLGLRVIVQREKVLLTSLIFTAFFEPLYHIAAMLRSGEYDLLTLWIIGIHIWMINLFQLFVFRKSGFYHMFLFRLGYYLIWHVAWGYFRLEMG